MKINKFSSEQLYKRHQTTEYLSSRNGQQPFDLNEGIMSFMAPAQIISRALGKDEEIKQSGWVLHFHPHFL